MKSLNESELADLAVKNGELFIEKEKSNLITFTKDSRINYRVDTTIDRIKWNVQQKEVLLPGVFFLEDKTSQCLLWHVYYELALYQDWQKHPTFYLHRLDQYVPEINEMTCYLRQKIIANNLKAEKMFAPEILVHYVKREIVAFLSDWDRYFSFLRVYQLCPIYRQPVFELYVNDYLKKTYFRKQSLDKLPSHQIFAKSFLLHKIEPNSNSSFNKVILEQPFFEFVEKHMNQAIINGCQPKERDEFFKSFVFPQFKQQWKQEIDEMIAQEVTGEESSERTGEWLTEGQDCQNSSMEMNLEEETALLESLLEEKKQSEVVIQQLADAKVNLEMYGVSFNDQELYQRYVNQMNRERQAMFRFWETLIGKAKKEVNKKQNKQLKGKLDVNSVINQYIDLAEAETIGNYRELALFNRNVLVPQANNLPEEIDITFLIDNSGSMTSGKIEAARKALTATLLSLEDFSGLLKKESTKLNQRIHLTSSTWFFGSHYYQVKFKEHQRGNEKQSEIIKSIIGLNGKEGATDDASCLKEILENITPREEKELKTGKRVQLVFEITDGASSFPGKSKEMIGQLIEKEVGLFAFQIGRNTESTIKTFNYVWNDWPDYERGILLGEDIDNLTDSLLTLVAQQIKEIWINKNDF